MGRDGWSEEIQWNKHGSCFCCELSVISQFSEFVSSSTIEWLLITAVGALSEQQNSDMLTLHTNSVCRQYARSDLLHNFHFGSRKASQDWHAVLFCKTEHRKHTTCTYLTEYNTIRAAKLRQEHTHTSKQDTFLVFYMNGITVELWRLRAQPHFCREI